MSDGMFAALTVAFVSAVVVVLAWVCLTPSIVDRETRVEHGCVVQYVKHGIFAAYEVDPDQKPVCP